MSLPPSLSRLGLLAVAGLAWSSCKPPAPAGPLVGWHVEPEVGKFACYYPPNFAKMSETDRMEARSNVMDEVFGQWRGQREDGVSFEAGMVDELETVVLGDMSKLETVVAKNTDWCKKVARGEKGGSDWEAWVRGLSSKLTEGECFAHFDYTLFDYLEIDTGWQRELAICKDDRVRISGTSKDRFRISDGGDWINVDGDPAQPTVGDGELPCNIEGCVRGQLIMRFRSDAGVEVIQPVGTGITFTAPENGTISYRINDDTFYDNKWYQSAGIIDHASVEISPN